MSDVPNTDAPAVPADNVPAVPADTGTTPVDNAPKWEGDFDPERAARLVANLRGDNDALKAKFTEAQAKLTEYEQAQMSDMEKLTARATAAESELANLTRKLAVADALRKHGLSDDDAEWLTGDTAEEIDARAAKLAARGGSKPAEDNPLPPTLPVPGNGTDPASVAQLTRAQFEALSPADQLAAYREGRTRNIGGK